jgi:hypothetical protein
MAEQITTVAQARKALREIGEKGWYLLRWEKTHISEWTGEAWVKGRGTRPWVQVTTGGKVRTLTALVAAARAVQAAEVKP